MLNLPKPQIFLQGLLLFLFGLIFLILNIIIAANINENCLLLPSQENTTKSLLTTMNVLCAFLMIMGLLGIFNFKLKILDDDSFTWFYKYGSFFPAITFLVCSLYLLSMVNKFDCNDLDANSTIKNLCYGIVIMSVIYFITTCVLLYNFHSETSEEIIEKADSVSKDVSLYTENDIKDIKLVNRYDYQIKTLEKALQVADIDRDIEYNKNIEKLNKYKDIAIKRHDAKEIYRTIQGKKIDEQLPIINDKICQNKNYNEEQKIEILKELNKLNSKLPKECENAPVKEELKKSAVELAREKLELTKLEAERAKVETEMKSQRDKTENPISDNFEKLIKPTSEIDRAKQKLELAKIESEIRKLQQPVQSSPFLQTQQPIYSSPFSQTQQSAFPLSSLRDKEIQEFRQEFNNSAPNSANVSPIIHQHH